MDLCRKILMEVESWETTLNPQDVKIPGEYTKDEIGHHAYLLAQGGLLEGRDVSGIGIACRRFWPRALTWQGHEFLDAARDNERWQEAKKMAKGAGGLGFDLLKAVLTGLAQKALTG